MNTNVYIMQGLIATEANQRNIIFIYMFKEISAVIYGPRILEIIHCILILFKCIIQIDKKLPLKQHYYKTKIILSMTYGTYLIHMLMGLPIV